MAIGLGSSTPTDFALGATQVDSIYLGSDLVWPPPANIFIGNGSGSVPNQATLEGKLSGETVTFFRVKGIDVQAVTTTTYSIDTVAFLNNTNITSYIDGGNCTFLTFNAFSNCTSLVTANFPSASSIDTNVFTGCTSLVTASFPSLLTIDGEAFSSCTSLVTASFPSVTSINYNAFSGCTSLKQAIFPSLSGSTAIGGTTGDNQVFGNVAVNGTGSFPSFYSSSNAGSPDGDIAYLSSSRGWQINWL